MPTTESPLRYPGGKYTLAPYVKRILVENQLERGHYVEPYAGGAGLALGLLFSGYASEIHLNDLNASVHNFWDVALNHNSELCKLVAQTDVSIAERGKQKERYMQNIAFDPIKHAFATFFLNRTNRSGILTAGVIGGLRQTGRYKLDARYNKEGLLDKLKKLNKFRSRIHLYNQDAADLISTTLPQLPSRALVYFDPPYYVKGQNLYQNHYLHDDHSMIAELIQASDIKHWMVSYDNVPQISALYPDRRNITYNLSYSAQRHMQGSEIIIFSDKLKVPEIDNPAKPPKIARIYRHKNEYALA